MDVFTHFVLPYVALWLLRRPHRERLAAGVGGFAPDADVLTAPIGLVGDHVWFLGHRGLSHSLVGAPLYALAVCGVLALPWWSRRWPRMAALRFDARLVALAAAFSFTHLALDGVTMWGVPLLFPLASLRFSLDWYYYSVLWAVPFSAGFVWLLWRRAPEARLRQCAAILVALLVASGAARLAFRPHVEDAVRTFPTGLEWQWATVREAGVGYEATTWTFGKPGAVHAYANDAPTDAGEQRALDAARHSPLAKGFRLYAGWPIAEQVGRAEGGGWNVTFTDVMRRAEADGRRWSPPFLMEYGILRLHVDEAGNVREAD